MNEQCDFLPIPVKIHHENPVKGLMETFMAPAGPAQKVYWQLNTANS